jgi:hypothetical protein
MTDQPNQNRSNLIAAAIILLVVGAALYFMPMIVLKLGETSPVLGAAAGTLIVLAFFLLFWLRSRFKK